MAEINGRLGAIDVPPERVHAAQDKYLVRARLRDAGQSAIDSRRLDDPELRVRLERGERYIVKPRRGSGSLFTQPVSSFGEVEKLAAAFRRGTTAGDIYEEFFVDNELIAESYFDGREISLEMLRQGGRTLFVCEHEKSVLTLSASAVLERGLSSPAVGISAPDLARGTELATRTLDLLQLGDGCYHVELRMNDARQWEIIEVNPRIGGGFIFDSVRHQYDRSLVADWIEVLSGRPVPDIAPGPRRCGTYLQVNYAEAGRTIATLERNDRLPAPAMFIEVMKPGAVARGDREDIGAMSLWLTSLDTHSALVATLVANEYVTFQYR
jgi:predicted ATP-grasp superfamily ATP-dependent carboligase